MKKLILIASLSLIALIIASCSSKKADNTNLTPETTPKTTIPTETNDTDISEPETSTIPTPSPSHEPYLNITGEEAKRIMDSGVPHIILDVRSEAEYRTGHIEGAILIPHTEIDQKAPSMLPDKDALILVYCRSGNRSKVASEALLDLGYKNIREFGGITDWQYGVVN